MAEEQQPQRQRGRKSLPGLSLGEMYVLNAMLGDQSKAKTRLDPAEVTPQKLREIAIEEGYKRLKKTLVSRACVHVLRTAFDEETAYIFHAAKERMTGEGYTVTVEQNVQDGETVHRYVLVVKW